MEQNFLKYILEIGYKVNYKEKSFDFSSMGDIRKIYEKDGHKIIYGLHEKGKPPTLIYPRPKITIIKDRKIIDGTHYSVRVTEQQDDAMNICLQKESGKDILDAILNNKEFYYEL